MSPSGVHSDTRVRPDPGRDGTGTCYPSAPNPDLLPATAKYHVGLPEQIAAEQLRQVDELSLLGYPTSFDEVTRDVVYEALRLAAERVLGVARSGS